MPEQSAPPLDILIVGCGAIAGGYDEVGGEGAVRTHAGAYSRDDRFRLAACVEPDADRRRAFMDRWNVAEGYASLEECAAAGGVYGVASVCMPTAAHGDTLEALLEMPIQAVLAEKPLTADPERSRRIVDAYAAAGRPLAVNYLRRYDSQIQTLQEEISSGTWGAVQVITVLYAKGLLNCGSHAIDLLHFLLGSLTVRQVLSQLVDHDEDDPTVSALLETEDGAPVHLMGCDGGHFFPFEIDLVMEKGRLTLEDLGGRLRCRKVRPHPLFLHQPTLDQGEWHDTELAHALTNVVANVHDHLTGGTPLLCDGEAALAAQRVCWDIQQLLKNR